MEEIRDQLTDNTIWISADKPIADELSNLMKCKELEKTNHSTIAAGFVNESIKKTFLESSAEESVFISDAAPYMIKAAKDLQVFYPNLIHVKCFAYGEHRITEEIQSTLGNINKMIHQQKKFLSRHLLLFVYNFSVLLFRKVVQVKFPLDRQRCLIILYL